jgi:hypothetical protein
MNVRLQGLAIGNGFIDPLTLQRYSYFVREVGLVDDQVADRMSQLETAITQFINNGQMLKAYAVRCQITYIHTTHTYPRRSSKGISDISPRQRFKIT